MSIQTIVQLTLGFLTAVALMWNYSGDPRLMRWAPVLGLGSTPFWLINAWLNADWAVFFISLVFGMIWWRGMCIWWRDSVVPQTLTGCFFVGRRRFSPGDNLQSVQLAVNRLHQDYLELKKRNPACPGYDNGEG